MGLFELLDECCARLMEAGYPDVLEMTPRQLLHRVDVHDRLHARNRVEEVQVGILGARADQKAVDDFIRKASPQAPRTRETSEDRGGRRAPDARAARMDEELKKVGWA